MLILILRQNKMWPWKPPLPQPTPSPSLRYSCITMNDTRTPIVKLRQMADLFSKICSAVFLWKRVECVSPFNSKWQSVMELFLIPQFSLFENQFLQQSLLLEVDAYYLGVYSRKPPTEYISSVIYPTKGTVIIHFSKSISISNRHVIVMDKPEIWAVDYLSKEKLWSTFITRLIFWPHFT